MKMFKWLLPLVLVSALFVGCEEKPAEPDTPTPPPVPETPPTE